ncbi:MAG: helix-turn-helix domain-containing protein [Dehalococcoidia bacterium]
MRIGRTDFEVGNIGRVYQAVLDVVPEEEAIEESELRTAYDQVREDNKPSFEEVIEHLAHLVSRRRIAGTNFYIRRKVWLSSAEVARRLDVSIRTVQSWGQKGVLGARYVGDRLRFGAEQVEEWVRGRQRGTASTQPGSSTVTKVWDNEEDAQYDRL